MKNFIVRSLTGILFVVLLVLSMSYFYSYLIFFSLITCLAVNEFCTLVNKQEDVCVNRFICSLSGVYLFFAITGFCMGIVGGEAFIPYLLSLLYLMISELYLKRERPLNNWAYTMLSQLYVALPFGLLSVLYFYPVLFDSVSISGYIRFLLPLSVFFFLWASDTGAYCVGSLFGKHRLFERISPKKSWEGSIGGALLAILLAILLGYYSDIMSMLEWIGLAFVVVVFGTWGDLVESLMKRQLGVKDSGNILPGHGGILDRFDSFLLATPAAIIYLYTLSILG